jgi:GNAT superfamily N-acetyltransferase
MECRELTFGAIEDYLRVPIAYEVQERLVVADGCVEPVDPSWTKDYDLYGNTPRDYPKQFDVSKWGVLATYEGAEIIGGAILAFRTPEFELLEGRNDLAHVVDIRVAPDYRSAGVGRGLWKAAEDWSRRRGAVEMGVETQDVNVPACRFYQAMGCSLLAWDADAYGPGINEIQLIWGKPI